MEFNHSRGLRVETQTQTLDVKDECKLFQLVHPKLAIDGAKSRLVLVNGCMLFCSDIYETSHNCN